MLNPLNLYSETDMSGFYMVYRYDGTQEHEGTYGITHLMEHLMCKCFDDLCDQLAADGIKWNACTYNDYVVFYWRGLDRYVSKWKNVLYRRMLKFKVTRYELEIERKIVLEEYQDYFDDPSVAHSYNMWRKHFGQYGPLGQRESLKKIRLKDCIQFFNTYCQNPHVINVSKYDEFSDSMLIPGEVEWPTGMLEYRNGKKMTFEKQQYEREKTSVIFHSVIIEPEDGAVVKFICDVLSKGLTSPFYQELREKRGLVYGIECCVETLNTNGSIFISTDTYKANADEVIRVLLDILENIRDHITKERCELMIKKYAVREEMHSVERYKHVTRFMEAPNWDIIKASYDGKTLTYENILRVAEKYFRPQDFIISKDDTETWQ
jgi:predicted Zn-dependent peptidase